MFLEIFLVALALLGCFAAFWFYREDIKSKEELEVVKQNLSAISKEKEELQNGFIRANAENELYQKQLTDEKVNYIEQKEFLTQQLQLMGKDLVEQGSKTLKTESHQKLNELLNPFKEKLELFEKEVRENNKRGIAQYSDMSAVVKTLSEQHDKMKSTAQNLVDALRGENKVQGDWGEMALERILETSGLIKGQEYETQSSFRDAEGNLQRPDVIILLPENKKIIIDSKVSLRAFERYINEEDAVLKKEALRDHLLSLKTHIKQLGEKDYSHLAEVNSPEFVLLFIPLESSFALAVKEEPDLYELAMKQKIVMVTPSTLLATLKTVDSIWKHERTNKNAVAIAEQAGRLYDKFASFVSDLEKIGKKQSEASEAYGKAMNKLTTGTGNLMVSAEKLKKLGVKTKKNLDKQILLEEDIDDEA
jgi:DNA recombination protein RmuC|tara:strand:- start:5524 stop:6783 length:1260 start_codon:yes stop_codon:yes gene_type:complete